MTSSHYFYGVVHKYRRDEPAATAFWMQALDYAFDQDKRMVESVQRNMGGERDILKMSPEINRADKAAVRARRILKMLIEGGEQLVCAVADAEAA